MRRVKRLKRNALANTRLQRTIGAVIINTRNELAPFAAEAPGYLDARARRNSAKNDVG